MNKLKSFAKKAEDKLRESGINIPSSTSSPPQQQQQFYQPPQQQQPQQYGGDLNDPFVRRQGHQLFYQGRPFKFASYNAPHLLDCREFEVLDTMRTIGGGFANRVTRTYTLKVTSVRIQAHEAHILGWDHQDNNWIYNEEMFKKMDYVLKCANDHGVKLIIPIVSNDEGKEETNWVGNRTDLVRMRCNIDSYDQVLRNGPNFWTDRTCIDSFRILLHHLLNRTNTLTGVRYGDDPCVLAWETGNELGNFADHSPPPGSWTIEVARTLKELARNTLVMDGSFSRNDKVKKCWDRAVMEGQEVDIVGYHYYGGGDINRLGEDIQFCHSYGKVCVAGEFGFFGHESDYDRFLQVFGQYGGDGCLVWSIRPHSEKGGFLAHKEHVPGMCSHWAGIHHSQSEFFDRQGPHVLASVRMHSFYLNNLAVGHLPAPVPPEVFLIDGRSGGISWRGSAWCQDYEVYQTFSPADEGSWKLVEGGVSDGMEEGQHKFWPDHALLGGHWRVRGRTPDGQWSGWSNAVEY